MTPEEAKAILANSKGTDEPVTLPPTVLKYLSAADIPEGTFIEIGAPKDGIIHIEWSGRFFKERERIVAEADYIWTRKWTRKYWYYPIGLEQYLDLVRRAVEARSKTRGDVELTHYDDDGAYIQMTSTITTGEENLDKTYQRVRAICDELEEAAEQASDDIGKRLAEISARLSGWGSQILDSAANLQSCWLSARTGQTDAARTNSFSAHV